MFFATGDPKEYESSSSQWPQPCRHFQFPQILLATNNFDESLIIGRGGFGKVYKGTILNGSSLVVVAIKRLDSMSAQGAAEFWAEVEMLSKLRHCHLVSLIGYCNDRKEMILVYEYMPLGTLEDHLHKLGTPLSWLQRLKICIGAARGLDYLHTGTGIELGVIHRDVKSSNILLHESWAAKISDFGLSRRGPKNQPCTYVNTSVKGTFGYLDPDYFSTGRLTRKSDVYAFGVVLFEVLCRKRAVDRSLDEEQWGLARWAQDSIKEGSLKHIIDSDLRGQISPKCLKEFARIADRCLHSHPKQRPTMAAVVASLESVLALQVKTNNSLQSAGRTIFGRMLDMFLFPSNGENSAHVDSKLPSNSKGNSRSAGETVGPDNNMFLDTRKVPADCGIPSPCLKVFKFADLQRATKNFIEAHGDSKLPSNSKGNIRSARKTVGPDNNMFLDTREVPADCRIPSPRLEVFKFADLKRATRNFSPDMLLGEGGFGQVFLGWVDKNTFAPSRPGVGMAIAVKRCRQESFQGHAEWLAEVSFLGRLAHPNIISLLGYCGNEQEHLLVYEYMQNGSYDRFLFRNNAEPLSWGTRLTIMIGLARGLAYLHSSKDQVIYRDVKSSSLLLDQDFNAKLGVFGLVRCRPENWSTHVTTRVMAIFGYAAPEYTATGHLSVKSDIFGFGVVLLETLTGVQVLDRKGPQKQYNLVQWASPILGKKGELKKIIDPRLEQNYPLEGAFKFAALTLRCLADTPKNRPSSEEVLQDLEQIYAINK